MHSFLRQSTASQSRSIGPFLDDTDFKTAETGLTIANTDIKLMANGAASADKNSGGGTHRANGFYGVTFDATDTAAVGELTASVVVAGAIQVCAKFTVLEEAVYDALFAASAPGYLQPTTAGRTLDVSAGGEAGLDLANVSALTGAYPFLGIAESGTAQAASGSTVTLRSATDVFADDTIIGGTIWVRGSTNGPYWQAGLITDYVNSTKIVTATFPSGFVTPTGTVTYVIFGTAPSSGGGGGDATEAKQDTIIAALAVVDSNVDAILVDTGTTLDARIPAALVGGRMDSITGAMASGVLTATAIASDAITAAKVASDVTTELQSGLATASAVSSLQTTANNIETDTQDIQSRLPNELVSGSIKANVTHVIGDPVQEDGASDTNWGGAP